MFGHDSIESFMFGYTVPINYTQFWNFCQPKIVKKNEINIDKLRPTIFFAGSRQFVLYGSVK